jgi:uroporphyrinogen-III synthase
MSDLLKNRSILITRDEAQATSLATLIKAEGGNPLFLPVVRIEATDDWKDCDKALEKIESYNWIIFSSTNSVKYFLQRASFKGVKKLKSHLAAVGDTTAGLLKKHGFEIDLLPQETSAAGLLKAFSALGMEGQKVLIPCSDISRPELATGLEEQKAQVNKVVVYHTLTNHDAKTDKISALIKKKQLDAITFFSPSAVKGFINLMGDGIISEIISSHIALFVIGPTTAKALKKQSLPLTAEAAESTTESVVQSMVKHFSNTLDGVSLNA